MVAASGDGGRSWDLERQVIVWDAVGQEFLGVTHKPTYPSSHDNIAFGKPNLARLPGGDLIASWWCTQACVSHLRYARVAVTEPGVSPCNGGVARVSPYRLAQRE